MRSLSIFSVLTVAALAFAGACTNDINNTPKDAAIDAPPLAGPDASCFTNPTTNDEIINACTTSQAIFLHPVLPLLGSDGSLPPLP
jgi:hypothetical protein